MDSKIDIKKENDSDMDCEESQTSTEPQCNVCDKSFKSIKLLQRHSVIHIKGDDNKITQKSKEPHQCPVCNKTFKLKKHLAQHKMTYKDCDDSGNPKDPSKPHQCKICDSSFKFIRLLKRHQLTHKEENFQPITMKYDDSTIKIETSKGLLKSYECNLCDKSFNSKVSLRRHKFTHKDNFQCTKCKKAFRIESSWKAHMESHENLYRCEPCDQSFQFKKRYLKHKLNTHSERISCEECPDTFDSIDNYNKHMKEHIKTTKCDICNKEFRGNEHYLKLHIARVHNFECEYCDLIFKEKALFVQHMAVEHPSKNIIFKCDFCKLSFTDAVSLENHVTQYHAFKCEKCGKRFRWRTSLIEHNDLRTCDYKSVLKKYVTKVKCGICEVIMENSNDVFLEHHNKAHPNSEYKFQCIQCEKFYKKLYHLRSHQTTHENPGNFKCYICGHISTRLWTLGNHIQRVHPGNDIECVVCKEMVPSKLHLENHMKNHARSENFKCHVCNEGFGGVKKLKVHYRVLHPDLKIKMDFKCNECGIVLETKVALENHAKIHKQTDDYQYIECYICKQVYKTKHHLLRHHNVKHPDMEPKLEYKCLQCDATFPTNSKVKQHAQTHKDLPSKTADKKDEEEDESEEDDSEEDEDDDSESDSKMDIEIGRYECNQCPASFDSFHELESHGKEHIKLVNFEIVTIIPGLPPKDTFECPDCNEVFDASEDLEKHSKDHIKTEVVL
ncbi:hypothetical protein ACFFRR_011368 [Megaselia abdita]